MRAGQPVGDRAPNGNTTRRAELTRERRMRAKKSPQVIKIERTAPLRLISGSDCEEFTNVLVAQVGNSLWLKNSDPEERARQIDAVITSMVGMKPRDELEGMLIAQLIASHNAAM